ncbi:DUF1489 domain-containing protein [Methyloceanibacter sp.]|uniref:DUF1489 family protein n=1 Tax=Methyloceanibacter sp. TaxID=1965321 RepID=UPI002C423A9C|nr:DUF1489 domain-containing protein [Methyloceanibacter sp.]HML92085.1 DUF1489 domain-containing protein [Methyloceanibacter sp.]
MTVHLVKLCVGVDRLQELKDWQAKRLASLARAGQTAELCHKTKQMPRRRDDVLDGGSLYWVIKGFISARQRILDLKETTREDGRPCCGVVLDPEIVPTRLNPRRPFQGWRYLEADEAPPDMRAGDEGDSDMPPGMREELRTLRLID